LVEGQEAADTQCLSMMAVDRGSLYARQVTVRQNQMVFAAVVTSSRHTLEGE